jgi:hypothetical protein
LAVVVLGGIGLVSMAAVVISDILTAILITLIGVAAAGSIMLAVHLYRTRGVVARPGPRPAAARRRQPLVRARIDQARARPAVGLAARAAIPARQPLAIEAPTPLHARIGMPAGSGGRAMARVAAHWPGDAAGGLPPEPLLPAEVQQALAAPAEDVLTAR